MRRIEQELVTYALPKLRRFFVELYGCDADPALKTGIITFNVKDVHPARRRDDPRLSASPCVQVTTARSHR